MHWLSQEMQGLDVDGYRSIRQSSIDLREFSRHAQTIVKTFYSAIDAFDYIINNPKGVSLR